MVYETFEEFRKTWAQPFEEFLAKSLADLAEDFPLSSKMANYHFSTGGKRIRGLIPPYLFSLHGRDPKTALSLGAAFEMIHNATLVHDDLQDGDEKRRGHLAVWKKFSSNQAINCGDAMFMMAQLFLKDWPQLTKFAAHQTLNVIEGQALELEVAETNDLTWSAYEKIVRGKTSGLFALPIAGALRALGESDELVDRLSSELGLCFQIYDDINDGHYEVLELRNKLKECVDCIEKGANDLSAPLAHFFNTMLQYFERMPT